MGILKGTPKRALAEKLVDFLLDIRFQEDIPLQMFMFPANKNAELPEVFVKHASVAKTPVNVSPEAIDQKRDYWIEAWTQTMLR